MMPPLTESKDAETISPSELMTKGKRALLCSEFSNAVDCFEAACKMLTEKYGALHDELAMPHFLYGSALLELARTENDVLGEVIKDEVGSDSEPEEDGDEEEEEQVKESGDKEDDTNGKEGGGEGSVEDSSSDDEPANGDGKVGEKEKKDGHGEATEQAERAEEETVRRAEEDKKGSTADADGKEQSREEPEKLKGGEAAGPNNEENAEAHDVEGEKNGEDDDVETLQLAWEAIEVARNIFLKHEDAANQLRVAECLSKLAEIGQETGSYPQAITDLLECLEIRKKFASDDDRLIAGTHFELGVAYCQVNDAHSADTAFQNALEYLKKSKTKLERELEDLKAAEGPEQSKTDLVEAQIKEVTEIMSEVEERRKEGAEPVPKIDEPVRKMDKDVPVDDITHLIRKRPAEAVKDYSEEVENPTMKKARVDNMDCSISKEEALEKRFS